MIPFDMNYRRGHHHTTAMECQNEIIHRRFRHN